MLRRDHPNSDMPTLSEADFNAFSALVHQETGIFMGPQKRALMQSRLAKRLRAHGMKDFSSYRNLVESNAHPEEMLQLISALTTNVTRFFREVQHFEDIRNMILPDLIERARSGQRVRLWSAGCATGEEPYSLAGLVLHLCANAPSLDIKILASDIDPAVVKSAERGWYPMARIDTIPADYRPLLVDPDPEDPTGFSIREPARRLIAFRVMNLLRDWPFKGTFDIVMCRNVVIYFDRPTQSQLWLRFAHATSKAGCLFIGHSERLTGPATQMYRAIGTTSFQKVEPEGSFG